MQQKDLEQLIVKYQKAYYDGNELISDAEFDKLWDELKVNYPNSTLLNRVGSDTVKGKKIKHIISMGSQLKFNNEEDFRKWLKSENIEFPLIVEDKIDGNSCELQYKNGKLLYGVTRGDGYYGEDITRVVTHMISVPQTVSFEGAVRGEIVMDRSLFEKKYAKDFKNPRNLTAGLLKNENFNDFNDLRFIAYDITKNFQTEKDKREYLTNEGFDVVRGVDCCTPEEVLKYREIRNPKDSEYNIDGLILRQNRVDPEDKNRLLPKKIHAFKWETSFKETILRNIEWNRQGSTFTPVAVFDEIFISGTSVNRATLNNLAFIKKLDLEIGDKIGITKFGEIIPGVAINISKNIKNEHYISS